MRRSPFFLVAGATLLATAPAARAQLPGYSAVFLEPTGTGSNTDSFDVWVRLTLAPNATPFTLRPTDAANRFGLPSDLFPTTGYSIELDATLPFASYRNAYVSAYRGCAGTFSSPSCAPGPYRFEFNGNGNPARPSLQTYTAGTLTPGSSYDFVVGTFIPVGGAVPDGTYRAYYAGFDVVVVGREASGTLLYAPITMATTCPTIASDACAFIRTVGAQASIAPEPGSVALLGTGLLALGGHAARRRHA